MSADVVRKRDAGATREAILAAARRHFAAAGFDGVGVREIAAEAGVNAALVNRYFGSKEALFEAVVSEISMEAFMGAPRDRFGEEIATLMATKSKSADELDPTLLLVRSIASPAVGTKLRDAMERGFVAELAAWLGGEDAEQRAALILVEILGFDLLRRVAGLDAFSPAKVEPARRRLARTIQAHVDGVDQG
ncbi:MAG: TetR family transcriptional regulator [Pseudomonadota bacterium]